MIPFATQKLVLGIAATMGAIYAADQFLARLEQRELDAQARHEYQSGVALLREGRNSSAIDALRRAKVLDRDNRSFQVALADALIRDDQPQRAVDVLTELLDKDSNDGNANLLMARAMDKQQQFASADSYYHRAIYGTWPQNVDGSQVAARVELVHWLASRGDQKGLLSELILLEPLAASNPGIARDLPFLYRQAGATNRAVDAYRAWLHSNPQDEEAEAGLAETELQMGNFRAARQAFERAAELKPQDAGLKERAAEAETALEMDPTPRWLSSQEKLARSTRVLELTMPCASGLLQQKAQSLLSEKSPAVRNEAAEMRLDYAETIWNTGPEACKTNATLTIIMRKLAQ